MPSSELPRGAVVWIVSVAAAFGWFAFVGMDFVSNGFRSSICGAGFLELPQLCCVAPAWLAINGTAFTLVASAPAWRRGAIACEIAAVLVTVIAFVLQLSRPVPGCSAYM